jgi:hypothetical protein
MISGEGAGGYGSLFVLVLELWGSVEICLLLIPAKTERVVVKKHNTKMGCSTPSTHRLSNFETNLGKIGVKRFDQFYTSTNEKLKQLCSVASAFEVNFDMFAARSGILVVEPQRPIGYGLIGLLIAISSCYDCNFVRAGL